mmetsp:Transcript_35217/g.54948  ORF Transcript_35217/g.54948 Transcript_35217/m.54948 type:complete len:435 (-) Transcript_35217:46-1350(-)
MMLGGWLWGGLSDSWGRTRVLATCLAVNSLFGFLSAFSPEFYTLLACRFLSGLGVGGSIPIIFTYYSEFLPPSNRGFLISLMAISWPVGALFVSLVAWGIIPTIENNWTNESIDFSWRIFLLPCCIPALTGSVIFWKFSDESVKWLYFEKNNFDEVSRILNSIQQRHNIVIPEEWQNLDPEFIDQMYVAETKSIEKEEEVFFEEENGHLSEKDQQQEEEPTAILEVLEKTLMMLVDPRYRRIVWIQAVIWFSISFAFYGCYEFLPSYFDSIADEESNGNVVSPYLSSVISAVAQFPGVFLTAYLLKHPELRIDRGAILAGSMLLSCVCLVLGGVLQLDGGWAVTIFLACFAGASVLGFTILDVITPELAPTTVRSTSYGLLCAIGRIGAIMGDLLFGLFSEDSFFVPMLISSGFLLLGALFGLFLPSMKGKAIH